VLGNGERKCHVSAGIDAGHTVKSLHEKSIPEKNRVPFRVDIFGRVVVSSVLILITCVGAACQSSQFECMNGTCIHLYQRCDGMRHCPYGEDELNCTRTGE